MKMTKPYPRTILRHKRIAIRNINSFLERLRDQADMGLHIGAGATKIPGLINCDLFNESADLKVDSRDLSQFENGSV